MRKIARTTKTDDEQCVHLIALLLPFNCGRCASQMAMFVERLNHKRDYESCELGDKCIKVHKSAL